MKKIIITLIPHRDLDYKTSLLSAEKLRKNLIGYSSVRIDEIEDKSEREEE